LVLAETTDQVQAVTQDLDQGFILSVPPAEAPEQHNQVLVVMADLEAVLLVIAVLLKKELG
jgi:hypothetical protein